MREVKMDNWRITKVKLPAIAAVSMFATVSFAGMASAQDQGEMLDKCRAYAASHLKQSADKINVKFEGQRTDKTFAVNGDVESDTPITFQCSFGPRGAKVVDFVSASHEGCPVDVSEADRSKYPACG